MSSAPPAPDPATAEHLDVLIVGAGISGIGAGRYLRAELPSKSFAILEARAASGGTWDLFRYPGIRSDSDLHTFGYEFKPWRDEESIASAPRILDYLRETVAENGLDRHIRYHHKVTSVSWPSEQARWTVLVERTDSGEQTTLTCSWLFAAGGYYRYDQGFTPHFEGRERFRGTIVHPQHWPEDLDYAGKRVVVIGSGATAVTLLPAMAGTAAHVTMLQRSPTYYFPERNADDLADTLRQLTMATKSQQKAWLKLFRDPKKDAPTGYRLKAWLFGGAEIPVSSALFPVGQYDGNIVADLFGEEETVIEGDVVRVEAVRGCVGDGEPRGHARGGRGAARRDDAASRQVNAGHRPRALPAQGDRQRPWPAAGVEDTPSCHAGLEQQLQQDPRDAAETRRR